MSRPSTLMLRRLLFALVGLLLLAGLLGLYVALQSRRPVGVTWAVQEAGSDGRSLVVSLAGPDSACGSGPNFEVEAQTATSIVVRARAVPGNCGNSLEKRTATPVTLRLRSDLAGQAISGTGKAAPRGTYAASMPNLRG